MNRGAVLQPAALRAGLAAGLAAVAIAAATVVTATPASGGDTSTTIKLTTKQETTGATGKGRGSFTWSITGDQLCYTLEVSDLTTFPFAAHLHPGERRMNGPAAVGLLTPPAATSSVSACITAVEGATGQALSTAELAAIAASPDDWYVNVHTATFPGGEIRGQLK